MNTSTESFPSICQMRPYFAAVQSELATKGELKTLRELQSEFDSLQTELSKFGTARARFVARENREQALKDPDSKLELSKERLAVEHRERRRVLKAGIKDLSRERILPTVESVYAKALTAVEGYEKELTSREQLEAARVEVGFEPSRTLLSVRDKIRVMRETLAAIRARSFTGDSPRGLLESILEF